MGVLEQEQVADQRWRVEVNARLDEHMERLDAGDDRMTAIEATLRINTDLTAATKNDTATIVSWVKNVTGFNNILNWLFSILLKLSAVIVAGGIVWWAVKDGTLPRKAEAQPALPAFADLKPRKLHG